MEPAAPVRPVWSSTSFLFYAGTFVALVAAFVVAATAASSAAGFAGWSALVAAVAVAAALVLQLRGQDVLAGLAAFVAVAFVGAVVGGLAGWAGLDAGSSDLTHGDFAWARLLVELALVVAGIAALMRFGFPLIVLLVGGAALLIVLDVFSFAEALFAALAGAALIWLGVRHDRGDMRPFGFWLHVLGGLALGGAILDTAVLGEFRFVLVAAGALVYVAAARFLGRSSYAVFAAIGVLIAATHWIAKWVGFGGLVVPLFGFQVGGDHAKPWQIALAYVAVGVVLVLLGVLARPRPRAVTPLPPEAPASDSPTAA